MKLEEVFEEKLVKSWKNKIPEYAKRVQELDNNYKKWIANYEIIGYIRHYNSTYQHISESKNNDEMMVFYNKKENKLYGSFQYNTQSFRMIDLQSINCSDGIADTSESISKLVSNSEVITYRPNVAVKFMQDFSCKKKEGIPYYIHKRIDEFKVFELKKGGSRGRFIAKAYSYNDAIDVMKGSDAEIYLVYINGDPNVFYKDILLQNKKDIEEL